MGRQKLPPDQKVSPAESAKRYREKNNKVYQLYEKRRQEERKLKRLGKPDVIKMKFNKSNNSKKTKKVIVLHINILFLWHFTFSKFIFQIIYMIYKPHVEKGYFGYYAC